MLQGLLVEEILYYPLRASLSHPSFSLWDDALQQLAIDKLESMGEFAYYNAANARFEEQVRHYGGWDKLRQDTAQFREVNRIVADECAHLPVWEKTTTFQAFVIQRKHVCLVSQYRLKGFAAQFGEEDGHP